LIVALAALVSLLMLVWRWLTAFLSSSVGVSGNVVAEPSPGFSAWILVPIAVAIAGWAVAYAKHGRPRTHETASWQKRLYVFFLNKGYFDEIYDVYIVRPTIGIAGWLWRVVDQGLIDRFIVSLGPLSVNASRWLWRVVDLGVIDRLVESIGIRSVGVARRMERINRTGTMKSVERLGRGVDVSGHTLQELQPRTLQHDLLVVVFWLAVALGFFYWIA